MKLEPIRNPHAQVGAGIQKKTKQEEKDELIEKTKKTTLDKYGVSILSVRIPSSKGDSLRIEITVNYRRKQLAKNTCKQLLP